MSEQILLQGKLLGVDEFLASRADISGDAPEPGADLVAGRSQWLALLGEVLPRALLAELGLARVLLGSSGGGQFLVVLPEDKRAAAEQFLTTAARHASSLSNGHIQLLWSITENLGDWSVVRKRLTEQLHAWRSTPLQHAAAEAFAPFAMPI